MPDLRTAWWFVVGTGQSGVSDWLRGHVQPNCASQGRGESIFINNQVQQSDLIQMEHQLSRF